MTAHVFVIAESDASGASGLQADIKTIMALSGYAMTAVSAITTQDSAHVISQVKIEPHFIAEQMRPSLERGNIDCIKVGFLPDEDMVNAVADLLDQYQDRGIPIIVDPSIVARSGKVLVNDKALAAWKRRLYVHTSVLTPNLREAELLCGMKIHDMDDMRNAASMIRTLGVENVVLKGGQLANQSELYFVASDHKECIYERPRIQTGRTLGAGSTFSSALAVNFVPGRDVFDATIHALDFLHQAILHTHEGENIGAINQAFHLKTGTSFHPEMIKVLNTSKG
jgi:hydroxymethylpyrimidine/phosphomethylpyrimidine kinase